MRESAPISLGASRAWCEMSETFDYVIVGSGPAGCVLAKR
jgi:hypothetical protein